MTEVEKKTRQPRRNYGYAPTSVIRMVEGKSKAYRGQRKEWYASVSAYEGKTVAEWEGSLAAEDKNPPRGWLRFFAQDGTVKLDVAA